MAWIKYGTVLHRDFLSGEYLPTLDEVRSLRRTELIYEVQFICHFDKSKNESIDSKKQKTENNPFIVYCILFVALIASFLSIWIS